MKSFKKTQTGRTLHYFVKFFMRHKFFAVISLTATPLAVLFGEILVGYYVGKLFQDIVGFKAGDNTSGLYHLAGLITILYVIQIIFYRINDYTVIWHKSVTLRELERYVFKKLPVHSYGFFADTFSGALVSQVNRFLQSYEMFYNTLVFDYLEIFAKIIMATIVLLFIAPPLGILLAVWTPVFVFVLVYFSAKKSHLTRAASSADSKLIASFSDAITNMITIKSFSRSELELNRFKKVSSDRYKKRLKSWRVNAMIRDARWIIVLIFFASYIYLSIYLVIHGQVSPATVVAGQIYVFSILTSLLGMHVVVQNTEQLFSDAAELTAILDMEPELKDPSHPEVSRIQKGLIKMESVDFRYDAAARHVFKNLDLKVPAGQKLGLVGHSGSGKSTITKILLRFMDINDGSITIDGQDIRHITQDDLRASMAYVPQEPLLFHRTIKENIGYGRDGATDDEIITAAKLAHADEFIKRLPDGYETLVGERGVKLSGGERQRVAIARAMLTKAPILILDEATSALDSKSEKLITSALDDLMKNRTTIVVAHRLSTIKKMDRIIVLKDGAIIEDGDHDQLLALDGEYAELWNHQSGNFLEP